MPGVLLLSSHLVPDRSTNRSLRKRQYRVAMWASSPAWRALRGRSGRVLPIRVCARPAFGADPARPRVPSGLRGAGEGLFGIICAFPSTIATFFEVCISLIRPSTPGSRPQKVGTRCGRKPSLSTFGMRIPRKSRHAPPLELPLPRADISHRSSSRTASRARRKVPRAAYGRNAALAAAGV